MFPIKQPDQFLKPRIIIPDQKLHPDQIEEMEEELAPHQKLHLKDYSSANAGLLTDQCYIYYCGICAKLCLITQIPLQQYPIRRTDQAICIELKERYSQHWFKEGGQRYVKRINGIEQQYLWNCECGVQIGYQCASYEDTNFLNKIRKFSDNTEQWKQFKPQNKLVLYILQDALVIDMLFCKLITKFDEYQN